MNSKPACIYVLKDPRTDSVRYVGWTTNPIKRYREHLKPRRVKAATYKEAWLRSLLALGMKPLMEIIESNVIDFAEREKHWIRHYRDLGVSLTNGTDGGEGMLGWKPSPETRAKLSVSVKVASEGKPNPFQGRHHSPETRLKFVAALKTRIITAETRQKLSVAMKARPVNREAILKGAKANTDKVRVNTTLISPGDKIGRLTALAKFRERGYVKWACICSCGNITSSTASNLVAFLKSEGKRGSRSCGCARLDALEIRNRQRKVTHA